VLERHPRSPRLHPQTCAFRDHHAELNALGAGLFGLSTQDTEYQKEAVERLHLPFERTPARNIGDSYTPGVE